MNILLIIILIVAVGIAIVFAKSSLTENISVRGHCGLNYYVSDKFKNLTDAADLLCEIHRRCEILITHLIQKNTRNQKNISWMIKKLSLEYDWDDFTEHPTETFNVDKGEKIHLCMRHPDGQLYDINILMFVILHELSHIITKVYDTTPIHSGEFWANNVWLLREAIKAGIYKPIDYKSRPIKYCGISITSSPLYK